MRIALNFIQLLGAALANAADFKRLDNLEPGSIEDYKTPGKWLIVMLWASDCHICNREAHAYQDFHFAHSDDDASIVGLTLDGQGKIDAARSFVKRHGVEFPNLIGEPSAVAGYYQELTASPWLGTPTFLVFGPDGDLAAKQVGAVPVELIEQFIASNTAN